MSQKPLRLPTSTLPTSTSPSVPPSLQSHLLAALLHNDSIPKIQSSLSDALATSGWTANLRAYINELLRSGECATYNEVLAKVMSEVGLEMKENGTNGTTNGNGASSDDKVKSVEDGGLKLPKTALRDGVKTVRTELQRVAEIVVDDE